MKWSDQGGGDFEQVVAGSHIARCVKIIDLGTQKGEYEGKITVRRQSLVTWELPNELMTQGEYEGQPFQISVFYTSSLGPKARLRKDLESWRGRAFTEEELKGFDPVNILGKPCMISVVHTEKGKAKVSGVMAMPKGMVCPPQIAQTVLFSLDEFKQVQFDMVSKGIQDIIRKSPEYIEFTTGGMATVESDDDGHDEDIPF